MRAIENLRREIDVIDGEIKKLLDKRLEICEKIGIEKANANCLVFDASREQKILGLIKNDKSLKYGGEIAELYGKLFEISKKLQKEITAEK